MTECVLFRAEEVFQSFVFFFFAMDMMFGEKL
jgi:hypothetical protein